MKTYYSKYTSVEFAFRIDVNSYLLDCTSFPPSHMIWLLGRQEIQLLVLRYREDLITAKVGQEHQEELLKSEIMFLRDQIVAEQQERNTVEDSLTQEINNLQQELSQLPLVVGVADIAVDFVANSCSGCQLFC